MNLIPSHHWNKACSAMAVIAALVVPSAATASPDWTPARALPGHLGPTFGYANGEETEAHLEIQSESPVRSRLLVTAAHPGEAPQTQLEIPTTADGFPVDSKLAVAPHGEAVLVWRDVQSLSGNTAQRFHVRYRSATGAWEPEDVVLSDEPTKDTTTPLMQAVIGLDGTAAVVINHYEKDDPGEAVPDERADALVHPGGGAWESAFRLSPPNRSSSGPDVGVDAEGNVTATYAERYNETTFKSTAIVRRRSASNKLWTTPEDLTQSAPNSKAFAPNLDVAPDGRAVIAMQRDSVTVAAVRESRTASFGPFTQVSAEGQQAGGVDAAIAPDGTTYVSYIQSSAQSHVGLVRAAPGGSFTAPRRVSPTGIEQVEGQIAFAGGDAVLGWTGRLAGSGTAVVQGTRWASGSGEPDAFRDLDVTPAGAFPVVVGDGEGSAVMAWSAGLDGRTATFDGGGPVVRSADVPQDATAGASATVRGSFVDRWSPLAGDPSWDFGDGTSATGGEVGHAWSAPGDYTVTLRGSDAFGNSNERRFTVHVSAAPAAPAQSPPVVAAAPTVTLKAPKCSKKLSRAACKRFLRKPAAWKKVGGTASNATRVAITVKRKGTKTRTVKATLKNGNWAARLSGLKAGGTTTISAQAVAADGAKSNPAARTLRLRR